MALTPISLRDFSKGVYRKYALSESLVPSNSVAHSVNFNYDTVIGKAVVRAGTTKLGATVASGKTPLGLSAVTIGSTNNLVAVFAGTTTPSVYYYDSSWHTSNANLTDNTKANRFASLGGRILRSNGTDGMTSSLTGAVWTTESCITTDSVIPSLLFRSKGRMLASGYSALSSRVYFSAIVTPTTTPSVTWSTDPTLGDFIDINPDDGGKVTGFAETSNVVLVFKDNGMYRLNIIDKTVDPENIFPIGAPSQEAITGCQGVVYYFSGIDIRRTSGAFPEQISRLGVQEFIDAIAPQNWQYVTSGTDGFNIYFYIGNITLRQGQNDQQTLSNIVLKFSTRDESWSVHSYADGFGFFCNYTISTTDRFMVGADASGDVQTINNGTTDNGTPIYYEIETQEQECGDRAHLKSISDKIVVFMKNGIDSQIQVREGDGNWQDVQIDLKNRVNIGQKIDLEDYYFTFKIFGTTSGTPPIFEGIEIIDIQDRGINVK